MIGSLKILFCVNVGAGTRHLVNWEALIGDYFSDRDHVPVTLMLGEGRNGAIRDAIKEHRPDLVVAVGGDGTVNLVAGIVGGTGMPMGIIPAGSANGLATDLEIPKDHIEALDLIISGMPKAVDAILINDKDMCLHLSDLGMNARLIKYFDETPARGMFTYARLSVKVLLNKKPLRVNITTDKGVFRRAAFMVVLANARKYGTGATINKDGVINDGAFEVVIVRRFDLRELWDSLSARRRFDPKRIEVLKATEVEITMERPAHFQVDGDHKGRIKNVRAKILPGHLLLIHPLVPPS